VIVAVSPDFCNQAIALIDPGQPQGRGFECNGDVTPTTSHFFRADSVAMLKVRER
jgi:hypothetical protein